MNKSMKKMMDKPGAGIPGHEKNAKMHVLHHMKKMAEDAMKGHMDHGMQKVSVMSDDKEGLAEGLDRAKDIIAHPANIPGDPLKDGPPGDMMHDGAPASGDEDDSHEGSGFAPQEGSPEEESSESPEEASAEGDDMSHEEIDAKIKHLLAIKHKKMGK